MKLNDYLSRKRGRAAALARVLQVRSVMISQWRHNVKPVPVVRCTPIEQATGGNVTRKELRPDDWFVHWPELTGKKPKVKRQKINYMNC